MIFKIFKLILAFFVQNGAIFVKNFYQIIAFLKRKTQIFSPKISKNRRKL
jgi:hypothetical protein